MEDQSLYQLALHRTRGIGHVYTRKLIDRFGDAASVFRQTADRLKAAGLPSEAADTICNFRDFTGVQHELDHLRKSAVRILFYKGADFPPRLLELHDAPALLFYRGSASLDAAKIVGIAGTRKPTPYGIQAVQQIIRDLARPGLLIVSGLAFGIDAAAHVAALSCKLSTIGVLGSGLGNVQPREHWGLARKMCGQGGLLSTFAYHARGTAHSFPQRNELIAGLSDALIVIESGISGGSLSAAAAAATFRKPCFAVPGRITDGKSQGCLNLIHQGAARPFLSAAQFCAAMGWEFEANQPTHQPRLPFSTGGGESRMQHGGEGAAQTGGDESAATASLLMPTAHEEELLALLRGNANLRFEDLHTRSRLSIPVLSGSLLDLELRGIIKALPGQRYHVVR